MIRSTDFILRLWTNEFDANWNIFYCNQFFSKLILLINWNERIEYKKIQFVSMIQSFHSSTDFILRLWTNILVSLGMKLTFWCKFEYFVQLIFLHFNAIQACMKCTLFTKLNKSLISFIKKIALTQLLHKQLYESPWIRKSSYPLLWHSSANFQNETCNAVMSLVTFIPEYEKLLNEFRRFYFSCTYTFPINCLILLKMKNNWNYKIYEDYTNSHYLIFSLYTTND